MANILIIRFSALGDVAMTIPVVYSFAEAHPMHQICFLSRRHFQPLFQNPPDNLHFISANLHAEHKGFRGLNKLYNELAADSFDYVIDLHDVLRSKYLSFRFRLNAKKVACIDKGRKEKKRLTQARDKDYRQLKSTIDRYTDTFARAGFNFEITFKSIFTPDNSIAATVKKFAGEKDNRKWIGIAPFAKHKGKVYPERKMLELIKRLTESNQYKIFVFGGGHVEERIVQRWESKFPELYSTISKLNMIEQMQMMGQLDVMISMDSGNMHLASLVATPVLSVWGATHPYTGFMGWNQRYENAVQIELPCRPCSVFGDKPCLRNDYACMYNISTEVIVSRIEQMISN